jgi:hypothetical protein
VPRELVRALADRLLTLLPKLRRRGVWESSDVVMLDAEPAARMWPLFD